MVPPGWEHPRDGSGEWVPIRAADMPDWPAAERTHFQMYETISEGTPVSPVCATAEELASWMADHCLTSATDRTALYESWLETVIGG